MELRHLRYFVAVGEEQHYGRGAQRLRVAQPALSRQIQDLEEEVGFKLFDRLSRGVKLSPAGKLFLEEARRILQHVEEATKHAKRVASGQLGTLRVGFIESMSCPERLHATTCAHCAWGSLTACRGMESFASGFASSERG